MINKSFQNGLTPNEGFDGRLQAAIARLSESDRQLVRMRIEEECTFEEMGRRMGCSAVRARKAWMKAIERLRSLLRPDD